MRKILIGLGNPGKKYERTYHNAGRLAMEAIFELEKKRMASGRSGQGRDFRFEELAGAEGDLIFVWPTTYMNESGLAVKEALKYLSSSPEELLVLHDDSDLTVGSVKISESENSAGHHGIISIQETIEARSFQRFRIGIRDPKEASRRKAEDFVLQTAPEDRIKTMIEPVISAWMDFRKTS